MRRFLLFLAALLAMMPFRAGAETTRLRVTLQVPVSNHLGVNLIAFKNEVEARTKGAIAVEIHDSSRLYRDDEVVGAVASGAIEMGTTTSQQLLAKVPALGIFDQPFLLNTEALVRAATSPDGEFRALLDQAVLEATGVRVLWWQSYGNTVVFSKKGRDVRNPEAIRDVKVRVLGTNMGAFTRYCRGKPVLVSGSKQYQAAKDGTVEMVMTGITGVDTRKLWEVTDTVTRTEHTPIEFLVIINEKVWQSLSPGQRAEITKAARKVEKELRDQMVDIEAKAYAFARAKGMKVVELEPDDVAEWRACSAPLVEDFMQEAGELGRRLMAAYGKLRMDPCCNAGPAGTFSKR